MKRLTFAFGIPLVGLALVLVVYGRLTRNAAAEPTPVPEKPLPEKIEFNRDIRPILSENCYACHGPDARKREAGLRLDQEKGATHELESGAIAIVPGKCAESALVARITSDDDEERMPPPESGKTLTPRQIELLQRWIEAGAVWEGHWSFTAIKRPAPPPTADPAFVKNPIDTFILEKQRDQGLAHSPEADRVTLIRRLSFDLTGLPPTADEVDRFVADTDPRAYEMLVDRLLDSPHFGERMAMFWLDLVRYADSVGYHGDQPVSVFPFRDYVIQAFNENKRFDQFTIEQLAGDLLPNPTLQQRIAAGYNRLGMMSAEGGGQPKEYLAKYASERVRNASGAWMGVTMGCCECHDHKFDPFTTKDFYRFEAFFADISEQGIYSGSESSGQWGPTVQIPTPQQATELARLDGAIATAKTALNQATPELTSAQAQWEQTVAWPVEWTILKPLLAASANGATLTVLEDDSILASGENPETDTYTITATTPLAAITAFRVEVLPHESLPKKGCGRSGNGNFVLTEFIVSSKPPGDGAPQPISFGAATASFEQKFGEKDTPYGKWSAAGAIDGDAKGAGFGWATLEEITLANHAVFETKADVPGGDDGLLTFTLLQNHGNDHHTIGRFRLSATSATRPVVALGAGLPRNVRDLLTVPAARRDDAQKAELAAFYRSIAPALDPTRTKLAELEKARDGLNKTIPTTLVTVAIAPRVMRVLPRGNWMDDSGEEVAPAVPEFLPQPAQPAAKDARLTRMELAQWLISPDNPLTARALVNRFWKMFFGAGLSKKLDDLGAQGDWPGHPLLLDYLAGQLIDSGWDIKRTIKLIVTSGTYRQTSIATPELREKDPFNRWLARQARFRLDAELVRDNALAVCGLLVREVGGPSVKPYQPPGYWSYLNFPTREWQNGAGDQLYRRGLYTHWQRQYLHPSLMAFDAPSREECTAERGRSNTPLQSLALLNDPTYVEAARVMAEHAIREGGSSPAERLNWAFRRAVSRPIRPAEQTVLAALYEKHLAEYRQDSGAAADVLTAGAFAVPTDIDRAELAAWTSVTRTILNLHETITRN